MPGSTTGLFLAAALLAPPIAWPGDAIRVGIDAEGGAPYTFYDPDEPSTLVGFEVEIAREVARRAGAQAVFVQNAWDALIPGLDRGDYDVALGGIEVTPDRAPLVEFSRPYYVFQEELTVRAGEDRIRALADLRGRRAGTLSGSLARQMLEAVGGVEIVTYPDVLEPYRDLLIRRVDAVLLDVPVALYYGRAEGTLVPAGPPIGRGLYAAVFRRGDVARRDAFDRAIGAMLEDGTLRRILDGWKLWNGAQAELSAGRALTERFSRQSAWEVFLAEGGPVDAAGSVDAAGPAATVAGRPESYARFLPPLLAGAAMTLLLSIASFVLAVALGLPIALARVYGAPPLAWAATAYVEVMRGTPLLIQLLVLYYGLPEVGITFPAIHTAILGLGLNYAAYESEVYRAAILAVPVGQMEAALSLGMGRAQSLRWVILPQALRTALPPSTNDFIALFKDSSLVSVITVVELTKTFQIFAASTYSYGELGAMTAALYLAMSLPMAALARRLERRLEVAR